MSSPLSNPCARYVTLAALAGIMLAVPLCPARAQSNLLTNPGFETGALSGWGGSYGGVSVVTLNPHAGVYCAAVSYGSGVVQTVTGLAPNTTYTCSGWLKVATAGDVVYLGAKNYGGTSTSRSTNTTTYTNLTFSFTTGPSATSADVFIYQSGAGTAYGDDLSLTGNNLLTNPGFETGDTSGWAASYGNYAAVSTAPHSGTYCARVAYASGVRQTVTGLSPNTTYTCNGWLKVTTAGQAAYLIAQNYNGTASVSQSANTTAYTNPTITFTTGTSLTSASIVVYQSGADPGYADDLTLTAVSNGSNGDLTGTQATRIADCLQRFGVNTFSKIVMSNGSLWSWGGSQGAYDSGTMSKAINYLLGSSGLTMNIREYHKDASSGGIPITAGQKTWMQQVYAATGCPFTLSLAANGSAADIPGMVDIVQDSVSTGVNYVKWVEGINEPNNDFGSGQVPIATTAAVQASLFSQIHGITSSVQVVGPSIIFGLPDPDAWISSYSGTYLQTLRDNSDMNNLHLYPPNSPNANDGSTRGGFMPDVDAAWRNVYPGKPALNTEWHPTMYCSATTRRNDPSYDAYWGPIYLLSSCVDENWTASFWFALYDYKTTKKCGLFVKDDTTPYPVANSFRAMFQLTGDQGTGKLTFTPGKLDVTVAGLPTAPSGSLHGGGRWALMENSAHTYFLFLWNEQYDISATTVPVTVTFNSHNMTKVEEFNITSGSQTAVQNLTSVHTITVNLDTSVRLLRITY